MRTPSRPVLLALAVAGAAAALVLPAGGSTAAAATASCSSLVDPVLQRVRPSTGVELLTLWKNEADLAASRYGFTDDHGTAFRGRSTAAAGLTGVHRLYAAATGDFLDVADPAEIASARARGYVDQGVHFYASTTPSSCLVGVVRFTRNGVHRMAVPGAGTSALAAAGWRSEGVRFYARPAVDVAAPGTPVVTSTGTTFSFAAVPDTQQEVLRSSDPRLANRSAWVLRQPGMSFLLQTGDLVNWDTDQHEQWANAKRGLAPVERARLPYTVAVGNHDTMATGPGGSAREPGKTHEQLRDTTTLNTYFSAADFRGVGGAFEPGKVDNVYTLYRAGGLKWMVLTLEFCPRASAVAWANRVVAAHPDYNVILSTHYYLTADGAIGTTNEGYGDTSPTYLWQRLVSQHPNIKLVFSGHVGQARKARVDTGQAGNRIYSFLTTMHDPTSNPTRIVTVDTKARTLRTRVYGPSTSTTWSDYTQAISGLTFVR